MSPYYLGDLFFYPAHVAPPQRAVGGRGPIVMPNIRRQVSEEATVNKALPVFSHTPFPRVGAYRTCRARLSLGVDIVQQRDHIAD